MTTVAWDGKNLAADRQISTGGDYPIITGHHTKLARVGDVVVTSLGACTDGEKFRRWVANGYIPGVTYPKFSPNFTGLIMRQLQGGGVELLQFDDECEGMPEFVTAPRGYGNAGRDYVMGAMKFGATAMEAVCACQSYCVYTGAALTLPGSSAERRKLRSTTANDRARIQPGRRCGSDTAPDIARIAREAHGEAQ